MKGLITGVLAVLIAGGVTYGVVATKATESGDTMKSEEVSAEVPATRTVDLEGNKPWQWAKPELIEEWQQKGEVVYLWEDAEGIELLLQSGIDSDPEGYKVKSKYVQLFVNELLEQSPEKEPYLNALSESAASLADGDIESAKIKLDEAKQLRLQ